MKSEFIFHYKQFKQEYKSISFKGSIMSTLGKLALLLFFVCGTSSFAQISITGVTSAVVGDRESFGLSSSAGTDTQWFLGPGSGGATIVGSNNNAMRVEFTSSGTVVISATILDDTVVLYQLTKTVTVTGGIPNTPGNPVIASNNCGTPVLQRTGFNSTTGDTWYWQGKTANGTFTNKGAGSTYTANEGNGTYYIRARSTTGEWSPSSGSVSVTINNLQAGSIAGNQTICYGQSPSNLSNASSATNGDSYSYQWQVSSNNSTWTDVSGATGTSYNPSTTLTSDRWYRRKVSSCGQTLYTNSVKVTVRSPLTAGSLNAAPKICYGGDPLLISSASSPTNGDGTYTYIWQRSADNVSWTDIPDSNVSMYNPQAGLTEPRYFRRVVTSCGQTVSTSSVLVDVWPEFYGGDIQGAQVLCYGENPTQITNTTLPSGGDGSYTYSWRHSANGIGNWTTINGATSSSYDPPAGASETRYYQRVATSCNSTEYSNTVLVEIVPLLEGPTGTESYDVCLNQTTTINLTPDPDATTIRWYTTAAGGTHFHEGTSYITPNVTGDFSYYVSSYYDNTIQCESSVRTRIDVHLVPEIVYFIDADGDGYSGGEITACINPDPNVYVTAADIVDNGDCDDNDSNIGVARTWYLDADNDGYYVSFQESCTSPGAGYTDRRTLLPGDCDDNLYDPNNDCGGSGSSGVQANNYVYSRSYQRTKGEMLANGQDQNNFNFFTPSENVVQQITYFDGVGRPIQQMGLEQTPEVAGVKRDIVTHMAYDDFGRSAKEWLPYAADIGTYGVLKTGAEQATLDYYYDIKYENTANPFSQKKFENSPLSRVEQQAAPGNDWALGNGHEIEFEYQTNATTDGIKQYRVTTAFANNTYTPTLVQDTDYAEGELYKNITKDENHDGTTTNNHTVEEFKDKQGRVVLKRTYNNNEAHDTYYVYDDFGNLTYVLPPLVDTSVAISQTVLDELCYQYVYDYRNRLVEKQLPGKEVEYIVYNELDQPVLTQDANQREKDPGSDEWLFTKYDTFGRVAYTGLATSAEGATRTSIQDEVNNFANLAWETPQATDRNSVFTEDVSIYYSNRAYPNNSTANRIVDLAEVLTINYYDDYRFNPTSGASVSSFTLGSTSSTIGLATGSRIKVLGTADWITTATYYDEKARPIYTHSSNDYLGTVDIVESELDFVGKPLRVRSSHTRNSVTVATLDNFAYDHVGRLLKQTQCIGNENLGYSCGASAVPVDLELLASSYTSDQTASGKIEVKATNNPVTLSGTLTLKIDPTAGGTGGPEELIAYNQYDELGQLVQKKVGGTPGSDYAGTQGLQVVDYTYNVRGWLKGINDVADTTPDRLFNFRIGYNDGTNPLYNGNITYTEWRTDNQDNGLKRYDYTYDALNRITSGTSSNTDYSLGLVSYDKNGNITRLTRNGHRDITASTFGLMDDLTYSYTGNQLRAVDDDPLASDVTGFVDPVQQTTEYTYDANGNIKTDANKGITAIGYNHLNLPTSISINPGTISYIYDAAGAKLQKTATDGSSVTTEYAGNFVYEGGNLQFFSTPEGYVTPDGLGGYDYIYQYKDHLDNVRLSYVDNNGTVEIVEENNYYPFGLKHKGYNQGGSTLGNDVANRWKFGGKELDNSFNDALATYDFGARNYSPDLGRWMNFDPLAEQMRRHSPYNYAFDNPVFFLDPDGMRPCPTGDCPSEVYNGPGVAVGDNVVNQLEEVVVTASRGTVVTGRAEPLLYESSDKGERVYGFLAEGSVDGKYGGIDGHISGFSAGYEGYTEGLSAHGSASVYGLHGEAGGRLGTKDNNVSIEGEGDALMAEVSGDVGLYTGDNDKYGAELGGNAGAYGLKGEVTPSISIFGVQVGVTIGGSLGSAHIGAKGAATVDTNTKDFELTGKAHIGLGAGLKLGFTISNTQQRIYGSKSNKKRKQ